MTNRVAHEIGLVLKIQFLQNTGAMIFRGARADVEDCGDLRGGLSFGCHLENFPFARRESLVAVE